MKVASDNFWFASSVWNISAQIESQRTDIQVIKTTTPQNCAIDAYIHHKLVNTNLEKTCY